MDAAGAGDRGRRSGLRAAEEPGADGLPADPRHRHGHHRRVQPEPAVPLPAPGRGQGQGRSGRRLHQPPRSALQRRAVSFSLVVARSPQKIR